jgi:DNA-binding NarL/FixJ family response regulator
MNDLIKAALTPRQLTIAEALLDGLSNPEIGKRLGINERTVKAHLEKLYLKFQIETPDGSKPGKRIIFAQKLLCA